MWNLLVMWICNKIQKYDDYYAPHLCVRNKLELDMADRKIVPMGVEVCGLIS